jgi:hypothetical protein
VAALLVTVILRAVSNLLFLAAFRFRRDWFDDPALLVTGGTRTGELLRRAIARLVHADQPNSHDSRPCSRHLRGSERRSTFWARVSLATPPRRGVRSVGDLVGLAGAPHVARAHTVRRCGRSAGSTRAALT